MTHNRLQRILPLCVLCIILFYCCKQTNRGGKYFEPDVRSAMGTKEQQVLLSELQGDLFYVKLQETNRPLGLLQKVEVTDDFILVSDRKGVFQFDRNGQFVREIGRIGNGPGEHNGNIRFAVNSFKNEIIISSYLKDINVYELETGLFQRRLEVSSDPYDLYVVEDGNIALFTWELPGGDAYAELNEVVLIDAMGNRIDSIMNFSRQGVRGNVMRRPNVYVFDNKIKYLYHYRDTLHNIKEDFQKKVYAAFKTDNKDSGNEFVIPPSPGMEHYPDYISINQVLENTDFLFLTLQKGIVASIKQQTQRALFSKFNGQIILTPSLTNDFDGGMDFWPQWVSQGKLIAFYHAYEIIDFYEQNQKNKNFGQTFLDLVNSLKVYDNPVLAIIN